MTTAKTLIDDAAELAKIKGMSQTLPASLSTRYLRLLNEMLESWRNEGVDLGLSTLAASDTIYVDDSDILSIRYQLTELIAESANKPLNPNIISRSAELFKSLRAKYFSQRELEQPELLLNYTNTNILTGL